MKVRTSEAFTLSNKDKDDILHEVMEKLLECISLEYGAEFIPDRRGSLFMTGVKDSRIQYLTRGACAEDRFGDDDLFELPRDSVVAKAILVTDELKYKTRSEIVENLISELWTTIKTQVDRSKRDVTQVDNGEFIEQFKFGLWPMIGKHYHDEGEDEDVFLVRCDIGMAAEIRNV